MNRGHKFLDRMSQEEWLGAAPVPGRPLVELSGEGRVLVENHCGVMGYSCERILIKVSYGMISVNGRNLEILRMSSEQLVIQGCIDGVTLLRREKR